MSSVSLVLLALCSMPLALAAPSRASEPPPAPIEGDAFARARELHRQQRYDEAAVAYAEAWVSQPAPDILYDWAQVERLSGHCEEAVPLYDRFLAMDDDGRPPEQYADLYYLEDWSRMVERAAEARDQCRAELEPASTPLPPDEPETTTAPPVTEPQTKPEPSADPEPIVEDDPRSWRRDPAGIALVAVGSTLLGAGVGLMVTAEIHDANARDQPSHDDYLRRIDTAAAEQLSGIVALGVGGAVVLGGVIRFAVVARSPSRREHARLTPWGGRHGVGVGVTSRF